MSGISRNAPCPCGSGKKYKQCCGKLGQVPASKKPLSAGSNLLQNAVALSRRGDFLGAKKLCEQILSRDPVNLDALRLAGVSALQAGQWKDAINILQRQLKITPTDPIAHGNLGMAYFEIGKDDLAYASNREALRISPGQAEAHNNLGKIEQKQGRLTVAREHYQQAVKHGKGNPHYAMNLAVVLEALGEYRAAEEHYRGVLRKFPDFVPAHNNLALVLSREGDLDAAHRHFQVVLKAEPNNPEIYNNYGLLLRQMEAYDKAEECFRKAMMLAPDSTNAYINMGLLFSIAGRYEEAMRFYERTLGLDPREERAYLGLAKLHFLQDRHEEARKVYEACEAKLEVSPHFYETWSRFEEHNHNIGRAMELADRAAALAPGEPLVQVLRSTLARRQKEYARALQILDEIAPGQIQRNMDRSKCLFEKGAVLDKLGRFREAFQAYDEANRAKNLYTGSQYNEQVDRDKFTARRRVFSEQQKTRFSELAEQLPEPRVTPVFVLGFPRSGTSLLEQILASHTAIEGAGELTLISELVEGKAQQILGSRKAYPECLVDETSNLTKEVLSEMREHYMSGLMDTGLVGEQTRWVVDKMPHNSVHMGLIALLFPHSPIIHISRHPLDSCLSAYFANFDGHRYTSSLVSTATHYQKVMEMIEHYKKSLAMHFTEIRYQDLVDDQETVIRKLLEFIGADWDENCLQHHKSKRVVRTASYEQVTQKVYRSSLARYINYWESVQEIIPIVQPTIDRFGYRLKD